MADAEFVAGLGELPLNIRAPKPAKLVDVAEGRPSVPKGLGLRRPGGLEM